MKYKCIRKCFYLDRLFNIGEIIESDKDISRHFVLLDCLNDLRNNFSKKFKKEVPVNKKNNMEWIKAKLEE